MTRSSHWAHRQTLQDRLRAHMHRGDRIAVTVAGQRVAGVPEEVGADLLAVRTPFGRVDIHLTSDDSVLVRARRDGTARAATAAPMPPAERFRDALLAREQDAASRRSGRSPNADGIDGTLVVGADHVRDRRSTGEETIVPIAARRRGWRRPRRR